MVNAHCDLYGHKFTQRYDEVPLMTKINVNNPPSLSAVRDAMVRKVYVCDVCERCGLVVNRDSAKKEARDA
jgi:hypothetical protein